MPVLDISRPRDCLRVICDSLASETYGIRGELVDCPISKKLKKIITSFEINILKVNF